jgi:hypothetical protein
MSGYGRWSDPPAGKGEDPRTHDETFYADEAELQEEGGRHVTNDQEPAPGQTGVSSDKPGEDHSYPEHT